MRFSKGWTLVLCVLVAMIFVATSFAQETTAGVQGTIKDSSGAVLDKASVEVTSSALIGIKKVDTDSAGYYRFANLPPGDYTITVTMKGFKTLKQGGVHLVAGALPSIDLKMEVGGTEQTVEVSAAPPIVDVTQSKVQTSVSGEILDSIPKGRAMQSVIGFAPGARQEPLQSSRTDPGRLNGYQIDGASDAENVYMSEGLNITGIYGGGVGANVPMEFIQEVQVKSSSFEAEYGGANGGVINAIQKRGGPQWHGSIFTYYRGNPITANDQCINRMVGTIQGSGCGLRNIPGTATNTGSLGTVDTATGTTWTKGPFFWNDRNPAPTEYYVQKQDKWSTLEPGFEIGGPLFKDRLWLFSSYVPSLSQVTRTVNFTKANPGPRSFTQTDTTQSFLNRLDYRMTNAVRLFGAWQSGYRRIKGTQASLNPDSILGQVNTTAGNDPNTLRADTGSTNPLTILNFGADITLGSKLVITTRYGYFYTDSQDRGKSTGTRYVWQADSTCDTTKDPNSYACTAGTTGIPTPGGSPIPAAYQHSAGFANIPSNFQQVYDIFSRRQFTTDAAYFVGNFGGTHNLKAGYAVQRLAENVLQAFQTSVVNVWYGSNNSYTAASGPTATVCATAEAAPGSGGKCTGPYGYYVLADGVTTNGNVSTLNHSFYVQDAWTVHQSLTINGGVRLDKEFLPPYRPGAESISFGFGQKIAPRIGAAYDLFHNGKVKLYGSYGKFFDIMKFSLPRGSFGGDRWHDCAYALNSPDYTQIVPQNVNGKFCPDSGQPTGSIPGIFIENQNWRASAPGIAGDPIVDPKIHPMQTHEFVTGADWAINPKLAFQSRYARKRLDWTIEDMSLDDGQYYIGNPGTPFSDLLHRALPSAGYDQPVCPTCPHQPKAIRDYDGLEFRLIRTGDNWGGQFAYTWSRLNGNYAGLNDTYYTDGNGGRHEPNNGRAFDLPNMLYDGKGNLALGPLPTDRPNTINAFGYYRLKWFGMETLLGLSQSFAQGSPQSTCLGTVDSASGCQFVAGQGNWINFTQDPTTRDIVQGSIVKGKRSPWLNQTDLNFTHSIHVSKSHEGMLLGFNADISNVFNQRSPMVYQPSPLATGYVTPELAGGAGCSDPTNKTTCPNGPIGWDYKSLETNFNYMALATDKSYLGPGGVGPSVNTNVPDTSKPGFCTDGTAQPCAPHFVAAYAGPNTNGAPNTLSGTYGKALIFQSARTIRLQLKFTF